MKITTLKFTNLESSAEIENYLEKKMAQLEKYLAHVDTPHKLFIELAKTTEHHKSGKIFYAEADIIVPRAHLRAEAEAEDIYSAIDILRDEIKRQLKSWKDKKVAKARKQEKALE